LKLLTNLSIIFLTVRVKLLWQHRDTGLACPAAWGKIHCWCAHKCNCT